MFVFQIRGNYPCTIKAQSRRIITMNYKARDESHVIPRYPRSIMIRLKMEERIFNKLKGEVHSQDIHLNPKIHLVLVRLYTITEMFINIASLLMIHCQIQIYETVSVPIRVRRIQVNPRPEVL